MPFAAEGRCPKPPFSVASEPLFGETESQVAFVSACICAALGTLGNSLTFAVLIFNPSIRRHPTTPFLFSLAFSDLIMSTLTLPLMAMRFHNRDMVHGYEVCRVFAFFYYGNILVSIFSMTLIAINRFVGIYYPHYAPDIFTLRKSWAMVGGCWVVALGLMALPLFEIWGQLGYQRATFSCTVLPKDGKDPSVFLIVTGTLLPFLTMATCYFLIYWHVRRTGKNVREATAADQPVLASGKGDVARMTRKRERQLTRTLLLICISYLVCFLPSALIALIDPMPPCWQHPGWHVATYVIFWCSAWVNPVIYVICNRYYRLALIATIGKIIPCVDSPDQPSSSWMDEDEASSPQETILTASSRRTKRSSSGATTTTSGKSRRSRMSNFSTFVATERRKKKRRELREMANFEPAPNERGEGEERREHGRRHSRRKSEESGGDGGRSRHRSGSRRRPPSPTERRSAAHSEERRLLEERRKAVAEGGRSSHHSGRRSASSSHHSSSIRSSGNGSRRSDQS